MEQARLEKLIALNQHLRALITAGASLDWGSRDDQLADLDRYDASVAIRVGRGQTFRTAVSQNDELPVPYRAAMLTAVEQSNPLTALDAFSQPGRVQRSLAFSLERVAVPLLIVFVLGAGVMILLSTHLGPQFDAVYRQLEETPGPGVSLLKVAAAWLPVWVAIFAGVCVVGYLARRKVAATWSHKIAERLPGVRRLLKTARYGHFARRLAELLKKNTELDRAIPLAARQAGDPALVAAAGRFTETANGDEAIPADAEPTGAFPPLLRWALTTSRDPTQMAANLHLAARMYDRAALNQRQRWQFLAPGAVSALLGGLLVLAYGLALFTPFIELLENLSHP